MANAKIVRYWREGAEEAWKTVTILLRSRQYVHALFFTHLALEKFLKAIVLERRGTVPPPVHDLVYLARAAGIKLSDGQRDDLATITTFNIAGRYEDEKAAFRKKARAAYVRVWVRKAQTLYRGLGSR